LMTDPSAAQSGLRLCLGAPSRSRLDHALQVLATAFDRTMAGVTSGPDGGTVFL
jgi:hypothetical protein